MGNTGSASRSPPCDMACGPPISHLVGVRRCDAGRRVHPSVLLSNGGSAATAATNAAAAGSCTGAGGPYGADRPPCRRRHGSHDVRWRGRWRAVWRRAGAGCGVDGGGGGHEAAAGRRGQLVLLVALTCVGRGATRNGGAALLPLRVHAAAETAHIALAVIPCCQHDSLPLPNR